MDAESRRWWIADRSQHRAGGWRAQYDRMLRWRDRLHGADWSPVPLPEERLDDAYAFFQNCFALRDWLTANGATTADIANDAIRASRPLRICRDLCNASKHFDISRPSTRGFMIGRQYRAAPFVIFEDADGSHDLFEVVALAEECVAAWDAFLTQKKLLDAP